MPHAATLAPVAATVSATSPGRPPDAGRCDGPRGWLVSAVVLAAVAVHLLAFLGARSLWSPDEGRYAEIGREMLESGDPVTPRLNYVRYFEKPPLVYWMTAGSFGLLGENETAARLPAAVMGLLGIVATYLLAAWLRGRTVARLSAVILATSPAYFALSRFLVLDIPLTALVTTGLGCLYRGLVTGSRRWCLAAPLFLGLATLTKGFVAIVLPVLILLPLLFVSSVRELARRVPWLSMGLVYLLVTAPWFIAISRRHPEFLGFFLVHEHLDRFLTTAHNRTGPWWYFVPVIILGLFPWSCFLPARLRHRPELLDRDRLFLWCWAAAPFLFFTVSRSKLPAYVLPAFPPLAILVADLLAAAHGSDRATRPDERARLASLRSWLAGGALLAGLVAVPAIVTTIDRSVRRYPHLASTCASVAIPLGVGAAAGVLQAYWFRTGHSRRACLALVLLQVVGLWRAEQIALAYQVEKDSRQIAHTIRSLSRPHDRVVVYGPLESASALPFYLKRGVVLGGDSYGELSMAHGDPEPPEKGRFIDHGTTLGWLAPAAPRCFFVTHPAVFDNRLSRVPGITPRVIGRRGRLVAFTNR